MESRWYLSPGQTLTNTKIIDRKKALHITANAWKNITTDHLDKKRLAEEAIMKEQSKKKALKEESQAMVDQWPNSVLVAISNLSKITAYEIGISRIYFISKNKNVLKMRKLEKKKECRNISK